MSEINNERNSAPTGANETVDEMNLEASNPLGGASCSASSLKWEVEVAEQELIAHLRKMPKSEPVGEEIDTVWKPFYDEYVRLNERCSKLSTLLSEN
jgi:hypothetical protein